MPRSRRCLLISGGLALAGLSGCQQLGFGDRPQLDLVLRNYTDREQLLQLELMRTDKPTSEGAMALNKEYRVPAPEDGSSAGTIRGTDIAPERKYLVRVLLKNGRFERFHAHYYPDESETGIIDISIYRDEATKNLFVDFRVLP